MAPAVRLHEAVALAGRFPLLAGASLEVAEGEVVHLRGPNGAGKTSLLKVLAGLLEVHSGEAIVLGRDLVADRRAVRREVGMLGHQSFLYEELTVEENVRFAVRATRGALTGVRPALEQLGFAGRLASTTVGRCSAGQQRRAAIAVLVARGARLWLLDEPHAGLDQEGRDLLDELLAGSRVAGRTVVFASHEHERAEAIADRVVHLAGGRVIESTEPAGTTAPAQTAEPNERLAPAEQQPTSLPVPEAPAHVA
ncbi:MAG TPA: heme ABC exporter ATP-binding protein CcmA [Acidimicrobiales bacterium]|nr:heme ABC exporter ATP-binding protein CcmA [Acidimicrobiales bacterium]